MESLTLPTHVHLSKPIFIFFSKSRSIKKEVVDEINDRIENIKYTMKNTCNQSFDRLVLIEFDKAKTNMTEITTTKMFRFLVFSRFDFSTSLLFFSPKY